MASHEHEQSLRHLAARRLRAEKTLAEARAALVQGIREAVADGLSQRAVARAAGLTQGRVWQFLEEGDRPMQRHVGLSAAAFCRAAKIPNPKRFRQWLRDNGRFVGQGNWHQLPEPSSPEGRDLIARFKRDTGL
jgi:hypothetical protein